MIKILAVLAVATLSYCSPVAAWTVIGKEPTKAFTLQEGTFIQGVSKGGSKRYYQIDENTKCDAEPETKVVVPSTYEVKFGQLYKYYTTEAGGQTYPPVSFADECPSTEPEPEPQPPQECETKQFSGQQKLLVNPSFTNKNDCQYLLVNIKDYLGNGKYDIDVTMYDGAKVAPLTGARTCTPPL